MRHDPLPQVEGHRLGISSARRWRWGIRHQGSQRVELGARDDLYGTGDIEQARQAMRPFWEIIAFEGHGAVHFPDSGRVKDFEVAAHYRIAEIDGQGFQTPLEECSAWLIVGQVNSVESMPTIAAIGGDG